MSIRRLMRRGMPIAVLLGGLSAGMVWGYLQPAKDPPAPPAAQQEPDDTPAPEQGRPADRSTDIVGVSRMRRWLEGAQRDIDKGQHIKAVAELQRIFDSNEDWTVQLEEGSQAPRVSLKKQALSLMAELVKSGRQEYETQFGEMSQQLLDQARRDGSPDLLETIVRRYFHTQAGYAATFVLACDRLDRGAWLDAAIDFDRLRECPWAAQKFEPGLSLKAALAWQRAGYPTHAEAALRQLKESGVSTVNVADKAHPLFATEAVALTWLTGVFGPPPQPLGPTDWLLVGGDLRRTAVSRGNTPYLNQGWHKDTIAGVCAEQEQDDQLRRILEKAAGTADSRQPMLPALQPLVVGDMLIYRTLGGLRAVNSTTGQPVWSAVDRDTMLDRLLQINTQTTGRQANPYATLPMFVTNRAWRDQTYGVLSSDGTLVYSVEPSLTPFDSTARVGRMPFLVSTDNRLVAYDLKTGAYAWEIGSSPEDAPDPFAGAFFLGPPLPVGNRLYCLADYSGDLRFLCLNPQKGSLDWSQSLVVASQQAFMPVEPIRRTCGLSPSFAGGIFVCPTEEGSVMAFDGTARTLLWNTLYESTNEVGQGQLQMQLKRQRYYQQANQGVPGNETDRWLDALALIADDRILLTPRDLNELLCLELRTGKVLWRVPRGDGLFVAGVHQGKAIVVGYKSVTARQLLDGAEAWTNGAVPIPLPSGRGFISNGQLFLPLSSASVVSIDLDKGQKGPESIARDGRAPGNLVATPNAIVTQGVDFIDGYRHFAALEAEIAAALEKNADDANALSLRGEIRLQRGQKAEAYADFQKALALKPDDTRARKILVDSLMEGLRTDFVNYRDKANELEALIADPLTRANYVRLVAAGHEQLGERLEAFKTYMKFTDPEFATVPPLDRDGTSVSAARLVRSRLARIVANATPQERLTIAAEVRRQLDSLPKPADDADPQALRRFLAFLEMPANVDTDTELAQISAEARQRLLDILERKGEWIEAELHLRQAERSSDAAASAAATARLAMMLASTSRPAEALPVLDVLRRDLGGVKVKSDQTGSDFAAEWLAKSELQPPADVEWPTDKPRAELSPLAVNRRPQLNIVPVDGGSSPFFAETTFEIDLLGKDLTARDRHWQPQWKLALSTVSQSMSPQLQRLVILDHLLFLSLGTQLIAIDSLGTSQQPGPRVLWRYAFADSPRGVTFFQQRGVGRPRANAVDSQGNPIGGLGAVTREHVYILKPANSARSSTLVALDTLSGSVVWTRPVAAAPCDVFTDGERVFVLPESEESADVYDSLDGALLGTREVPSLGQRLAILDGHLLSWSGAPEGQLARLDVWSGKTLWTQQFDRRSKLVVVDRDEVVVVEPERRLAVVQLSDGRRRIDNPEGMLFNSQALSWIVQRSRDRYVLLPAVPGSQILMANKQVMSRATNPSVVVGTVYAFDRASGRRLWHRDLDGNGLDLFHSPHLPVMLFLTQIIERRNNVVSRADRTQITVLDMRTGEFLFDESIREIVNFADILADLQRRQLSFRLMASELTLDFTRPPDKPEAPAPADPEKKDEKPAP